MLPHSFVEKARLFATAAHAAIGQKRKYTGEDYIVHPAEVAAIVASVSHTPEMLAAAWLHDVVEDTKVGIAIIEVEFGPDVAALVSDLTDVSKLGDGPRAARKAIDRAHLAKASPPAKTIKLADLIANSASIVAGDRAFARIYLQEKELLLEVLREGDATLHARAESQLKSGFAALGL